MQVIVNGVTTDVEEAASVAAVVAARGGEQRGVAVALNGDVVPRSDWGVVTRVVAGDSLEVLAPMAGG